MEIREGTVTRSSPLSTLQLGSERKIKIVRRQMEEHTQENPQVSPQELDNGIRLNEQPINEQPINEQPINEQPINQNDEHDSKKLGGLVINPTQNRTVTKEEPQKYPYRKSSIRELPSKEERGQER